jgi:hypothetical protein
MKIAMRPPRIVSAQDKSRRSVATIPKTPNDPNAEYRERRHPDTDGNLEHEEYGEGRNESQSQRAESCCREDFHGHDLSSQGVDPSRLSIHRVGELGRSRPLLPSRWARQSVLLAFSGLSHFCPGSGCVGECVQ